MSIAEIVDAYPTLSGNAVEGALRELAHEKEAAIFFKAGSPKATMSRTMRLGLRFS
jgi:hypothetical protein